MLKKHLILLSMLKKVCRNWYTIYSTNYKYNIIYKYKTIFKIW